MNKQKAYLYLEKYGGLDYLFENWRALYTHPNKKNKTTVGDMIRKKGISLRL
jgi:hypothetical protein